MGYKDDGSVMSIFLEEHKDRNPALEFINAICKIFHLVPTIEEEVLFDVCIIEYNNELFKVGF